jgi:hypothetical protein
VFVVGHVPAATAAAVPVPDADALVLELLELHAVMSASSATTKTSDNFRATCIPPQRPFPNNRKLISAQYPASTHDQTTPSSG